MGLRTRLSLLVILPIMAVLGVYGVVRVRSETQAAIETERRAAAVAALAVQIAVEQGLRTGDTVASGDWSPSWCYTIPRSNASGLRANWSAPWRRAAFRPSR